MPCAALGRRFAARSRMRGMSSCKRPRNAVEKRCGAFGANTELLLPLLTVRVPFDAQPCEEVDERGYRLAYENE